MCCSNPTACASWLMCKFLGVFLLLVGVVALLNYQGTVDMVMVEGQKAMAMVPFLNEIMFQLVAYTWPIAATLIGLSLLTCYKKCWAVMLLMTYMLIFLLGHMWAGNMLLAGFALLLALFTGVMKGMCGLGMMCEKK